MVAGIISALGIGLPALVKVIDLIKGGRKSPDDTQTGADKRGAAIGIIQILDALAGTSRTAEEAGALVDQTVAMMNATGQLPKGSGGAMPITLTGTLQIGAPK